MEYSYSFLILLLPFLSFLLLGLCGMKMKKPVAGVIGTIVLGCVFALSCYTAYKYFFVIGRGADGLYPTVTVFNFTWLKFTELLTFNIGFRLTPISVMMLIVITTVSFMVHIYSFGNMSLVSSDSTLISLSLRCPCSDWLLQRTSSRCICFGNLWEYAPIC